MRFFSQARGKRDQGEVVYAFTFKIASGTALIPAPMVGAYVTGYARGNTPTAAAELALSELRGMGYVVQDMDPTGGEISSASWDEHIAERWPQFAGHFPTQAALTSVLETERVIFGPFAGFESSQG